MIATIEAGKTYVLVDEHVRTIVTVAKVTPWGHRQDLGTVEGTNLKTYDGGYFMQCAVEA